MMLGSYKLASAPHLRGSAWSNGGVGIAMIVVPGPALIVIPTGPAILG
jgi:hypothetical protein